MWNFLKFKHKSSTAASHPDKIQETPKKEESKEQSSNISENEILEELDPTLSLDLKLLKEPLTEISYVPQSDEKSTNIMHDKIQELENEINKDIQKEHIHNKENFIASKEIPKERYFYSNDGKCFKSIKEFYENINNINDDAFNHHVQNNDFINWLRDVFSDYEAYQLLLFAKTKEKYSILLKELIEKRESKKDIIAKEKEYKKEDIKEELKNHEELIVTLIQMLEQCSSKSCFEISEIKKKNEDIPILKEKIEELSLKIKKLTGDLDNVNQKFINIPTKEEITELSQSLDLVLRISKKDKKEYDETLKEFRNIQNEVKSIKGYISTINNSYMIKEFNEFKKAIKEQIDTKINNYESLIFRLERQTEILSNQNISTLKKLKEELARTRDTDINLMNLKAKTADFAKPDSLELISAKIDKLESENKSLKEKVELFENNKNLSAKQNEDAILILREEIKKVRDADTNMLNFKAKTADFAKIENLNEELQRRIKHLEEYNTRVKEAMLLLEKQNISLKRKNNDEFRILKDEIDFKLRNLEKDRKP